MSGRDQGYCLPVSFCCPKLASFAPPQVSATQDCGVQICTTGFSNLQAVMPIDRRKHPAAPGMHDGPQQAQPCTGTLRSSRDVPPIVFQPSAATRGKWIHSSFHARAAPRAASHKICGHHVEPGTARCSRQFCPEQRCRDVRQLDCVSVSRQFFACTGE